MTARANASTHVGLAGWGLPPELRDRPEGQSVLARYAEVFNAVEINSTHYKFHQPKTFARWCMEVPADFRFAVKMHRDISHVQRLTRIDEAMRFLNPLEAFGEKLGVVLLQLPPSLDFTLDTEVFLRDLASEYAGAIAVEPRHPSWAQGSVEQLLQQLRMARVAADPPLITERVIAGGDRALSYYRFHGNPQMYRSVYSEERLVELSSSIIKERPAAGSTFVFFDNTMSGAAHANALRLRELIGAITA
jgi:uncharacterized protein YecE (DUF72 family)